MAAPKPTILLVHGAWHTTAPYRQFLDELETRGYPTVAPELPSGGPDTPVDPPGADVHLIAQMLRDLADQGREVVVVSHSYGGVIAQDAVSGLGIRARSAKGLQGGVRAIVFVAAMVVPVGEKPTWSHSDDVPLYYPKDGFFVLNPEADIGAHFYADIPVEEQQQWFAQPTPHPIASGTYMPKSAAYEEVDLAYVYCEADNCFKIDTQRAVVNRMKGLGFKFRERTLPSAHFPTLSMPNKLADAVIALF